MTDEPVYHVWFGTKKRNWMLLGDIEVAVKGVLNSIAGDKGIDLQECETMVDHVHLLITANPQDLPRIMHLLKGASSRYIFQKFPELKLDGHTNSFWQRRYGSKPIPAGGVQNVKEYIRTQKERLAKFDRPRKSK